MFVATLIANPAKKNLTAELGAKAAEQLGGNEPIWLNPGIASDIALFDEPEQPNRVWEWLQTQEIDMVVQPAERRRKKLLIADMDSTMIQQECIDELADVAGIGARVADITARAMNGDLDFESAMKERVGLLKGLDTGAIHRVLETRITYTPGGAALVATMKANGAYTALVSGGFTDFTAAVSRQLGFDHNRANILHHKDGHLSGTVQEPILGKEAKVTALNELCAQLKIQPKDAISIGDGANDLGMLQAAGTGVALHAKPNVAAQTNVRLNFADLTGALYVQGYKSDAIIETFSSQ